MRGWLRRHAGTPPLSWALAGLQAAHERRIGLHGDGSTPAHAGGRPARLVPLPAARPYARADRRELRRVVREAATSSADGDAVSRFERALEQAFHAPHAVAVHSGTAALHLALVAHGVGPGDEVVVPALTHAATALAVRHAGATPRFADVDPDTWTLDPRKVERHFGPRTRALLPVHLCGVPADVPALVARARAARPAGPDAWLVEDAAQAHGSRLGGVPVGTLGDAGCLSFQSSKVLTTGEGGALLLRDAQVLERARRARNLDQPGLAPPSGDAPRETHRVLGWNLRLGALPAAHGLGQLRRFARTAAALDRALGALREGLAALPGVRPQGAPESARVVSTSVFFRVPEGLDRDELARRLRLERLEVRLPYPRPLADHEVFGGHGAATPPDAPDLPNTRELCARALGLRVDPRLTPADVRSILRALNRNLT